MDRKEYLQKWREVHREEHNEKSREYYKEHKEHHREITKAWRQNHPDYSAKYYQNNREHLDALNIQYQKDNPDYKKEWLKTEKGKACLQRCKFKRRLKEKFLTNTLTAEEWQDILIEHDFRCIYCGQQFSMFEMTKDHIIPVSKGGANTKENIVPACVKCNSKMQDNLELKLRILENRIKKGGLNKWQIQKISS